MFEKLIFDEEMTNFVITTGYNRISAIFYHLTTLHISNEGNFIKRESDQNDVISYLPRSKFPEVDQQTGQFSKDPFAEGMGRVIIKIGRFARKFLREKAYSDYNIKDKEIEQFVNIFKSYFNDSTNDIILVEGSDIQKYYLEENYHSPGQRYGSLWNSCMRQRERNSFMKLYAKNPNIKMAILFILFSKLIRQI